MELCFMNCGRLSVCGFVIVFLLLLFSELKNLQVHGSNDGKVT